MREDRIKHLIIVGGGTAGWMAAAALSRFVNPDLCQVTLVESAEVPTVGVGEATIPQIQVFNQTLGLDENDFIRQTQGTFKLGIEFVDWGNLNQRYIHAFGPVGKDMEPLQFYHYWWKLRSQGRAPDIGRFALNTVAAYQNRFMRSVEAGNSPLSNIAYAFQFDAGLYAAYLRKYAESRGVKRVQDHVKHVQLELDNGNINAIQLSNGEMLYGDFFIDCTGFAGLLIEKALKVPFLDWSHWLPNDRAVAVPCRRVEPLLPLTRATARESGWQWRIPLQHRTGNGHVYSSGFIDDDKARAVLMNNLDGAPLSDPKQLRFKTGRRTEFWHRNCLALGLAAGFMEPLESTSIHLIQSALARFMSVFPDQSVDNPDRDFFNRQTIFEYDRIRDFIILHFKVTQREDSEYWRYLKHMSIPDSLTQKIEQFSHNGQIFRVDNELFNETSWLEVFHGQGLQPSSYHPLADIMPEPELLRRMEHIESVIARSAAAMPLHSDFIEQNCKADDVYGSA